jgi:hypothetical protein
VVLQCQKNRFEAVNLFHNEQPTEHYFPPVVYYLGRTRQALKRPAAANLYGRFLDLKANSERDPLVEDACRRQELLAKPQGAIPSSHLSKLIASC